MIIENKNIYSAFIIQIISKTYTKASNVDTTITE